MILSVRSRDSNHSTSAMESPVCIKQTEVVYALELTLSVYYLQDHRGKASGVGHHLSNTTCLSYMTTVSSACLQPG